MKKLVSLILVLVLAVCLFAGCGADKKDETANFKAGFIFLHDENSTYDLNFLNATKEACEALG